MAQKSLYPTVSEMRAKLIEIAQLFGAEARIPETELPVMFDRRLMQNAIHTPNLLDFETPNKVWNHFDRWLMSVVGPRRRKLQEIAMAILPAIEGYVVDYFNDNPLQYTPVDHEVRGALREQILKDRIFCQWGDGTTSELNLAEYYDIEYQHNEGSDANHWRKGKALGDCVANATVVIILRKTHDKVCGNTGEWRDQSHDGHVALIWTREE